MTAMAASESPGFASGFSVAGEFQYEQLSGLNGSDGAITLTNAKAQRISVSNVQLFVGVNGGFITDTDGNVTGLDTAF